MASDTLQQTSTGVIHRLESEKVMRTGGILPEGRSTQDLLEAVRQRVERIDGRFVDASGASRMADEFAEDMEAGRSMLGTPALSNIWFDERPLASCSAVPSRAGSESYLLPDAERYYASNMGSGFSFDNHLEPALALHRMNDHAADFQRLSGCERYVGNMGNLRWDHPRVLEFVRAKVSTPMPHFNISVAFDGRAEALWHAGDPAVRSLLMDLASSAWACGDPGILFPHRFNAKNVLRDLSPYTTTAPCAEVGLAPGDTCVFGYLSLPTFVLPDGALDVLGLAATTRRLVRVLDNLVEDSADKLPTTASRHLALAKRRIGVAACGFADLLVLGGVEYGSKEAVTMLEECLAVIQYSAAEASLQLAEERGPFRWFERSSWATGGQFALPSTSHIDDVEWSALDRAIQDRGIRNSALTALPPSGRTSIILGVNPSIEPFLGDPATSSMNSAVRRAASLADDAVSRTAAEIPWQRHLAVVEAATQWVDEAVSKTINLTSAATPEDVWDIFVATLESDICAMSIYRDGSIGTSPS